MKKFFLLAAATALHFFVDGSCAAALVMISSRQMSDSDIMICFAQYTLWAFGTQWAAGLLLDKRRKLAAPLLALALLLLAAGAGGNLPWMLAAANLGLANSILHVVPGKTVLENFPSYREAGIFVSSGAVGLLFGMQSILGWQLMLGGAFCAALAFAFCRRQAEPHGENSAQLAALAHDDDGNISRKIFLGSIILCACVGIRSFTGTATLAGLPFALPCVYALGKILGGIFCDRLGYQNTALFLLLASFAALQFTGSLPLVIFVCLSNMTMPLTLKLLHKFLPRYAGFAFGLAAACLLPGWYWQEYYLSLPLLVMLQFILLFASDRLYSSCRAGGTL